MTTDEALQELERLRGWGEPTSQTYKDSVRALYQQVTCKSLRKCNCKDVYRDALFEIYAKLINSNTKNMANTKAQARLVLGVVLKWENNHYTNKNLTDDVARAFLEKFPQRKDWFEVLPSATTEKQVTAEVAETAPEEEKTEEQATTPKKKKTARKRK